MIFLNRTACLGGDVTQYKVGTHHYFNNQQKVRVDMLMDIIEGKEIKPDAKTIISLLSNPNDMAGVYSQSENLSWYSVDQKPNYLIMDSYSELVDKKFTHKDGWSFCGALGDFEPSSFDDEIIISYGLMPIQSIKSTYDKFFQYIKNRWNVPIIFIHFPTTFDNRIIYKDQALAISDALDYLSPIYDIQNIYADDDAIENVDVNPYHFSIKTIKNMADKIRI